MVMKPGPIPTNTMSLSSCATLEIFTSSSTKTIRSAPIPTVDADNPRLWWARAEPSPYIQALVDHQKIFVANHPIAPQIGKVSIHAVTISKVTPQRCQGVVSFKWEADVDWLLEVRK